MDPLFDKDSPDDDAELKINENYAERYNQWREKEEFQKRTFDQLAKPSCFLCTRSCIILQSALMFILIYT